MMGSKSFNRGLKICCLATAVLLIIIVIVLVILYFALLKPKEPQITFQPFTLKHLRSSLPPAKFVFNVTLGIVVTVDNKNYGSFKYNDSKAYVSYRGNVVAEAPIPYDTVPARAKHNITTTITVFADKLLENPVFKAEVKEGVVNFTSSSMLHGKVRVWKLFKGKATSTCTCNISILMLPQQAQSVCKSDVKL